MDEFDFDFFSEGEQPPQRAPMVDPRMVEALAGALVETLQSENDPEDTITVALTRRETAMIGFGLGLLNATPFGAAILGKDICSLQEKLMEIIRTQKGDED